MKRYNTWTPTEAAAPAKRALWEKNGATNGPSPSSSYSPTSGQGPWNYPPHTDTCPATSVTAPTVVLATSYLLNESQSKMVTVGLSASSLQPILRISSPQKRNQVIDLNSDEAAQFLAMVKNGSLLMLNGPKELSSNVKVELREFSDVPVITISSLVTSSSVTLAEATVKRIAEMDFVLRKHLDRLARHAGKVFDWVNRFVDSMLSNCDVTPFWHKQRPLLRDVDEFAWRSSENFFTAHWMETVDEISVCENADYAEVQFLTEMAMYAPKIFYEELLTH